MTTDKINEQLDYLASLLPPELRVIFNYTMRTMVTKEITQDMLDEGFVF